MEVSEESSNFATDKEYRRGTMKIKILFVAAYMAISVEACHEKGKTDFGANWYLDSGMTVYELNNGCTVRDSIGDRKSTRLNSSHNVASRIPSSA